MSLFFKTLVIGSPEVKVAFYFWNIQHLVNEVVSPEFNIDMVKINAVWISYFIIFILIPQKDD